MAQCNDSSWTITLTRDLAGTPQEFIFQLQMNQGTVSGDVFLPGTGSSISPVTGACQPFEDPDVTLLSLSFTAGETNIFLVGFTHKVGPFNRFDGKFTVVPRADAEPADAPPQLETFNNGPGDTGTGTGQQT